jgi:CIC family chloride channel protein
MKLLVHWLNKLPKNTRQIILTCLFGASAGLTGVLFHRAIHWLFELGFVRTAVTTGTDFIWISLLIILSTSLASGYLLYQFCPQAGGSGIPQLKLSYWKDFGDIPFRVAWVKFVAGSWLSEGGPVWAVKGLRYKLVVPLPRKLPPWPGWPNKTAGRRRRPGRRRD